MSKKEFGPSRGASSVGNRLAGRYSDSTPAEAAPAQAQQPPKMVTRSWYLPAETADRLADTADGIWRAVPGIAKRDALAALIEAGLERADEVRDQLSQSSHPSQD